MAVRSVRWLPPRVFHQGESVRGQAWQGGVDGAGADQGREPGVAQFVMQGREASSYRNWLNSVALVESSG
jgi:hypothetical protein